MKKFKLTRKNVAALCMSAVMTITGAGCSNKEVSISDLNNQTVSEVNNNIKNRLSAEGIFLKYYENGIIEGTISYEDVSEAILVMQFKRNNDFFSKLVVVEKRKVDIYSPGMFDPRVFGTTEKTVWYDLETGCALKEWYVYDYKDKYINAKKNRIDKTVYKHGEDLEPVGVMHLSSYLIDNNKVASEYDAEELIEFYHKVVEPTIKVDSNKKQEEKPETTDNDAENKHTEESTSKSNKTTNGIIASIKEKRDSYDYIFTPQYFPSKTCEDIRRKYFGNGIYRDLGSITAVEYCNTFEESIKYHDLFTIPIYLEDIIDFLIIDSTVSTIMGEEYKIYQFSAYFKQDYEKYKTGDFTYSYKATHVNGTEEELMYFIKDTDFDSEIGDHNAVQSPRNYNCEYINFNSWSEEEIYSFMTDRNLGSDYTNSKSR